MIDRPWNLTCVLLLGLAGGCGADSSPVADDPAPPNVLLVVLDTLRPDHLGCYGYSRDTSPNLDQLAAEGIVFENAQSTAPWTAPSLASLLTSLHPDVHGVRDSPRPQMLHAGATTLAQVLAARGYATAAITEGGYTRSTFGLDRGFETYPAADGVDGRYTANMHGRALLQSNLAQAEDWLGERDERPFFLLFHTYAVHAPLRPPVAELERIRPGHDDRAYRASISRVVEGWNSNRTLDRAGARLLRRDAFYLVSDDCPPLEAREELLAAAAALGEPLAKGSAPEDGEIVAWVNDLYDAQLRYLDSQLPRLWRTLEARGQIDNTIIIVVSDHGEALGDNGAMGHGRSLHEALLHALLLVRLPNEVALRGTRVDSVVSLMDVMPTLLELTGSDPRDLNLQGSSLLPLMGGTEETRSTFGQAAHFHAKASAADLKVLPRSSIRRGPWHLIQGAEGVAPRLFHVPSDPGEEADRASAEPELVQELLSLLEVQRERDARLRSHLDRAAGSTSDEGSAQIDQTTLEELRRLGYIGDD